MTRYALAVDLDYCLNCKTCEVACKIENNIPLGERWVRVYTCGPYGEFPNLSQYYLPMQCQQCVDAPCVSVCPSGASYRDPETDIVLVDPSICIGCKSCLTACPYGVRNWKADEQTVDKCNLCASRREEGKDPFCVEICSSRCRYFGDLDDPESEISKKIAAKPDAVHKLMDYGNGPATIYLFSPRYGEWHEEPDMLHDTNQNEQQY